MQPAVTKNRVDAIPEVGADAASGRPGVPRSRLDGFKCRGDVSALLFNPDEVGEALLDIFPLGDNVFPLIETGVECIACPGPYDKSSVEFFAFFV